MYMRHILGFNVLPSARIVVESGPNRSIAPVNRREISVSKSIFEKIGGFKKVRKIVSGFYDSVLEEEILIPYFKDVDMPRLIDHQTKFFAMVLGGPASYTDDQLEKIHSGMAITEEAFDVVCELVVENLEDHDLDEDDIEAVASLLMSKKSLMVEPN